MVDASKLVAMKTSPKKQVRGVTLIELTLVIMVVLAFATATLFFAGNIRDWRKGKVASESLRSVYAAQRGFLADNPRRSVATLTASELYPYLPSGSTSFPAVDSLDGVTLDYEITVSPPVLIDSGGAIYDPSGKSDDSLWDVGE